MYIVMASKNGTLLGRTSSVHPSMLEEIVCHSFFTTHEGVERRVVRKALKTLFMRHGWRKNLSWWQNKEVQELIAFEKISRVSIFQINRVAFFENLFSHFLDWKMITAFETLTRRLKNMTVCFLCGICFFLAEGSIYPFLLEYKSVRCLRNCSY